MFNKRNRKRKSVDFMLQSSHYRRLHLYLYFLSLGIILFVYSIIVMLFSDSSTIVIVMSVVSLLVGIYLIFNRDELVKRISEHLYQIKRKTMKKTDKSSLKTTLRKITPKNNRLKFNIKNKVPLKERFEKIKTKFKEMNEKPDPKNKKKVKPDYIEIE